MATFEGSGELNALFAGVALSAVPAPAGGTVFTLPSTTTVAAAVAALHGHNFLSAPVVIIGVE
jgi:hypothetical protein